MKKDKIAISDKKGNNKHALTDIPTPIFRRAKKISDLADAEELLSRILSLFQNGKISAGDAKNLSYLCQVFAQLRKQALEEKKIFELIEFQTLSMASEATFILDNLLEKMTSELELSAEKVDAVAQCFFQNKNMYAEKLQLKNREIKEQINKLTSFKVNLMESHNYEEVKEVLFYKVRQLEIKERYLLLDELNERFYTKDDE